MFAQQLLGAVQGFFKLGIDLAAHSYQERPPALPLPLLFRAVPLRTALHVQLALLRQ